MSGPSTYVPKSAFAKWFDSRLPLMRFANDTMLTFPTPRNLNFWYAFGAILTFMLGIQILTGIVLAMHFVASADGTFEKTAFSCQECGWAGLGSQLLIFQDPAGDVDAP